MPSFIDIKSNLILQDLSKVIQFVGGLTYLFHLDQSQIGWHLQPRILDH